MKVTLLLLLTTLSIVSQVLADVRYEDSERFGKVTITETSDEPANTVIWFSEDGDFGSLSKDKNFTTLLAAGVRVDTYAKALREDENDCSYLAGEIVRFGQSIQSDAEINTPSPVWLGGEGRGATLAYAIYAQRPQDFLGVVGLNFCPDISFLPTLCPDGSLMADTVHKSVTTPAQPLNHAYISADKTCPTAQDFGQKFKSGEYSEIFATRPPVAEDDDDSLHLGSLSLIQIDPKDTAKGRMIFFSGDGGWAALDKQISEKLSFKGFEIFGVDCLRYYWKYKDPTLVAQQLAALLKQLHEDDPHLPVYLMGYSFGADILPHVLAAMDETSRSWVKDSLLINPEQNALFEVHISEWLGVDEHEGEVDTKPAVLSLKKKPYCICSSETEDSLCAIDGACKATKILPGDHHFDGDFDSVTKVLTDWILSKQTKS